MRLFIAFLVMFVVDLSAQESINLFYNELPNSVKQPDFSSSAKNQIAKEIDHAISIDPALLSHLMIYIYRFHEQNISDTDSNYSKNYLLKKNNLIDLRSTWIGKSLKKQKKEMTRLEFKYISGILHEFVLNKKSYVSFEKLDSLICNDNLDDYYRYKYIKNNPNLTYDVNKRYSDLLYVEYQKIKLHSNKIINEPQILKKSNIKRIIKHYMSKLFLIWRADKINALSIAENEFNDVFKAIANCRVKEEFHVYLSAGVLFSFHTDHVDTKLYDFVQPFLNKTINLSSSLKYPQGVHFGARLRIPLLNTMRHFSHLNFSLTYTYFSSIVQNEGLGEDIYDIKIVDHDGVHRYRKHYYSSFDTKSIQAAVSNISMPLLYVTNSFFIGFGLSIEYHYRPSNHACTSTVNSSTNSTIPEGYDDFQVMTEYSHNFLFSPMIEFSIELSNSVQLSLKQSINHILLSFDYKVY